jgi:hypothetical protein
MDISKYTSFFHDGGVTDIRHEGDSIEFSMYSAEMDEEDLQDDIPLSKDGSIQGRLHVDGVKNITNKDNFIFCEFEKKYKKRKILDFEVGEHIVEFGIMWSNYPYKIEERDYTYIKIEAEKIWWETIPDLEDLYP